jgi:hypothetical protein
MTIESTPQQSTDAINRLTAALDRVSARLDALPDMMERTYVRIDVDRQRELLVDRRLDTIAAAIERSTTTIRWVVSFVLVPTVLAILALLSARGGI